MISIRKAWWVAVLGAAIAGCGNEEPAGDNPAPPPSTSATEAAPPKSEMKPGDEAKPKDDEKKAEDAKPDTKTEEPKGDLKLEGPTPTPAKSETPKEEEKKADEKSASVKLDEEEIAAINKLPAADKDLALKQLLCPVSGEHLGSMGTPVKVSAEGKTFLLCCKGCNDEVKSDPKAVVAKLNQK